MKHHRKPHLYKKRKPIYCSRLLWLVVFVFVLSYSIFYFLFLTDFFQIREINTAGLQKIFPSRLKLSIQEQTGNKILFFPSRSIFLVNIGEIERDILGEFPSLVGIDISRNFPDSLSARVMEREGLASFCLIEDCFIIDKEGIAFEAGKNRVPAPAARIKAFFTCFLFSIIVY